MLATLVSDIKAGKGSLEPSLIEDVATALFRYTVSQPCFLSSSFTQTGKRRLKLSPEKKNAILDSLPLSTEDKSRIANAMPSFQKMRKNKTLQKIKNEVKANGVLVDGLTG